MKLKIKITETWDACGNSQDDPIYEVNLVIPLTKRSAATRTIILKEFSSLRDAEAFVKTISFEREEFHE